MQIFWGKYNPLVFLVITAFLIGFMFIPDLTLRLILALFCILLELLCCYHFLVVTEKYLVFCYGGFLIIRRKEKFESVELITDERREKAKFSFENCKFSVPFFASGKAEVLGQIEELANSLCGDDMFVKASREGGKDEVVDDTNYEELLSTLKRNAIKMSFVKEARFSKIGGHPDLPKDFVWPVTTSGEGCMMRVANKERPLSFVCQIDLAEASKFDKDGILPKTGVLSVFYEHISKAISTRNKADGVKVYYFANKDDLVRSDFVYEVNSDDDDMQPWLLGEHFLDFCAEDDYPSWATAEAITQKDLPKYDDFVSKFVPEGENWDTRLLGWPADMQGSAMPNYPKDSNYDFLQLIQINTIDTSETGSEENEFFIGGVGQLHIFIRKRDLDKHNFENIEYEIMC